MKTILEIDVGKFKSVAHPCEPCTTAARFDAVHTGLIDSGEYRTTRHALARLRRLFWKIRAAIRWSALTV
jgi:hypothetical protein